VLGLTDLLRLKIFFKMKPLKGNKKIDFLFDKGVGVSSKFVRCVFLKQEIDEIFYVVSVPKKSFPRAVDRNKIKRQLREVLRKNEGAIKNNGFGSYMIIYTHSSFVGFEALNKDVFSLF
jgi:ribonuclease P protein component